MSSRRPKANIHQALHRADVIFWDTQTERPLSKHEIDQTIQFIQSSIDEAEFFSTIDISRFAQAIEDFRKNNPDKELAADFYRQHRKTLQTDKQKLIAFAKGFDIFDLETFQAELKKSQDYPEAFYDEELRRNILEEQSYKCKLCQRDISNCEPHLHHIDYNRKNCEKVNLVFLCIRCHGKTNSKREYWKGVLQEMKASA